MCGSTGKPFVPLGWLPVAGLFRTKSNLINILVIILILVYRNPASPVHTALTAASLLTLFKRTENCGRSVSAATRTNHLPKSFFVA